MDLEEGMQQEIQSSLVDIGDIRTTTNNEHTPMSLDIAPLSYFSTL